MIQSKRPNRYLALLLACLALQTAAIAGEVQLAWTPSPGSSGYKIYRGTTSGGYSSVIDVGNTVTASATGLADCMMWYFATSAYNAAGESGLSSEVSSWPRAVAQSAIPNEVESGSQGSIVLAGTNFMDGDTISLSQSGIAIDSVSVDSCYAMTLHVTVGAAAPIGPVNVVVTHPNGVTGTAMGLLTVTSPSVSVPTPPRNLTVQ